MPRVASILFKMYHAWHEPYHATSGKWSSATRGILTHEWHKNLRCRATCGIASFHACTTHGKRCYRHVPRVTHGRRVRREATHGTKARREAARAVKSGTCARQAAVRAAYVPRAAHACARRRARRTCHARHMRQAERAAYVPRAAHAPGTRRRVRRTCHAWHVRRHPAGAARKACMPRVAYALAGAVRAK